jgi:hypothetical protein
MTASRREVALAIGVGDAEPLPYLSGAVNGARAFHEWASRLGYDSRLVTDEIQPVTIARLRSEIEAALKPADVPIHRLLIYFAGHGLIREAEEGLWLLSDWNDELKAVAVEVLKRRLYMHDIQQIAIFADSCRSLPPNIVAADLSPDPVLGRGPIREQKQPVIDKFIAAQDGSATFMVPGASPDQDRCLFSGLLMEGLWGSRPEAFSKLLTDKVTSRSLGAYLDAEVPKLAELYKRKLFPSVSPTFPEGDDIYFGSFEENSRPTPPVFPAWPRPDAVISLGARKETAVPLEDVEVAKGQISRGGVIASSRSASLLMEKMRSQPMPRIFGTRAGFAVEGASVRALWTTADVVAESHGQPNHWRLHNQHHPALLRAVPVLIEFEDGTFAATTALPEFIASVLRDKRGISALIYRPVDDIADTAATAEVAIAKMESGALRADDATDLAVNLRQMKHVDPVLGVISAYLYDSIGDVDNIRRMAFYYLAHGQSIPYDIALLAQVRGEWRAGILWAHVPIVSKREPRTNAERLAEWTHSATPARSGPVGGLWPWMRQGWTFLDNPADDGSTLIAPGLIELNRHLASGRFAMFNTEGGHRLAVIFGLSQKELVRSPDFG